MKQLDKLLQSTSDIRDSDIRDFRLYGTTQKVPNDRIKLCGSRL